MTALAKVDNATALARAQDGLSREQIDLIKTSIAKGASDAELALFVQTCNRLSLDPFARQIYLVPRYDPDLGKVRTPQVSIDGFRLVAERTRQYRGQDAPQWCGEDGVWRDVWLHDKPPHAARCGVYRDGFEKPMVRVARYTSYVQKAKDGHPTKMWRTMPEVMLAKCAEALALRAAFPHELGGIYSGEEMGQAENDPAPRDAPPRDAKPRRTLDSIASDGLPPHNPETGEVAQGGLEPESGLRDEFGLPIPVSQCPVFQSGPDAGRTYMDVPAAKIRALLDNKKFRDRASSAQLEWARYRVDRRAREKAIEAVEKDLGEAG